MIVPCSSLSLLMAASCAPLPSMVIVSGTPLQRRAFFQKPKRRPLIPVLCEQKINGLAVCVDRTIPIPPLAFDTNVCLVQAPADPHRPLATMQRLFQQGTVLHDPALDGRMVESHAALCHQCFDMAIAQGIRQIPSHSHQHDVLGEMGPFETDRHRRSPSLWYPHPPSESIPQSGSNEKCDRALFRPLRTMRGGRQP